MTKSLRPLLRYHGGKWLLAPWVISHFPPHRVYVEPFGGAASVLLQKPRAYAEVYNDLDGEIVNVFRVMQQPASACELERLLRLTPFARAEFKLAYEPSDNTTERARRTIIKSFMGFGSNAIQQKSGFRSNSNRLGTTPAHDWRNYADMLPFFHERLQGIVIECADALAVMITHDSPDTLFYVDPPYVASTRDPGRDYVYEMSDADHIGLIAVLKALSGMVILSGYRSDLYGEFLTDWGQICRKSLTDGARPRVEYLHLNPAALARTDKTINLDV